MPGAGRAPERRHGYLFVIWYIVQFQCMEHLEMFKVGFEGALSNLILWIVSLPVATGVEPGCQPPGCFIDENYRIIEFAEFDQDHQVRFLGLHRTPKESHFLNLSGLVM
ncbi:hypothetical protein HGM15179_002481 [Zosterops borbonicus]|uniref:Uncharacterized protein n=1 Tax=Zosterops borbonicus TaxID=364589 RepID=A0A8K1GVJ0_9PASS|nr:hypothetical protein HGM15179_002481 [Zosterops borbonicus]